MARFSDDELYRMLQKGQISEAAYLEGIEANCQHSRTETETEGNKWYDVCDSCGKTVREGYIGSGDAVKVATSGCVVIAVFMLATVAALCVTFAELMT